MYDVIIIGGGPAAIASGIYCARKKLNTLLITDSFGGQSVVSDDIQNWIGEPHISGSDLAKKLEIHLRLYEKEIDIKTSEKVVEIKSLPQDLDHRICDFEVKTDQSGVYQSKAIILCSGARRRELNVPGEKEYTGKGVSYCSICDSPLFNNKRVVVVGGGNSALEAVHDLLKHASQVYLLTHSEKLTGDPMTFDEIKADPNFKEIIYSAKILQILGEGSVSSLKYLNLQTNKEQALPIEGVFVTIGSVPNSEIVKDLVQLDEHNQVMINFQHCRTSHPGIFAAGDVTNDPYKQNNISVGDGIRATLACYAYLQNREKASPASEKEYDSQVP